MAEVKIEIDSRVLRLKERLLHLVATGELTAKDFDLAIEEQIVVRIVADGRTLNRLEKRYPGAVEAAIQAFKGKSPDITT